MSLIIALSRKVLSKPGNRRILLSWLPGFILFTLWLVHWASKSVPYHHSGARKSLSVLRKQRRLNPPKPGTVPIHSNSIRAIPSSLSLKPLYFDCETSEYSVTNLNTRLRSSCATKPSTGEFILLQPGGRLPGGHSQSREDRYVLERYFFDRQGGTFLEMGGLDGIAYSNSYYWERHLGWKGLLIEGSPTLYANLVRNRPYALTMNAMVCSEKRKLHWINSNNAVGGAYELMPKSFVAKWHKRLNKEKSLDDYPTVPCFRLDTILQKYGIVHVDVWTLDVEGAELSVLKTVNFAKFSASVIVVEYRRDSPGIEDFLTRKNKFVRVERIGNNNVYLHPMFRTALEENRQQNTDLSDIPA